MHWDLWLLRTNVSGGASTSLHTAASSPLEFSMSRTRADFFEVTFRLIQKKRTEKWYFYLNSFVARLVCKQSCSPCGFIALLSTNRRPSHICKRCPCLLVTEKNLPVLVG